MNSRVGQGGRVAKRNRVYSRILPPAEEIAAAFKDDPELTFTAYAARFGVSRQAVKKALDVAEIELNRPSPYTLKQFVPWRVKVAHEQHLHVRMLRIYAREKLGLPLPRERLRAYREWRQDMDELGLVVTYSPEAGFGVDERRPGDERYWRP